MNAILKPDKIMKNTSVYISPKLDWVSLYASGAVLAVSCGKEEPQTCEFEIANPSGDDNCYSYSSPHLRFNGAGAGTWIKLPLMEGRMLHSVTMAIDNTAGKSFRVDSPLGTTVSGNISIPASSSASFTSGSLSYDTAYYLYFVGATNFQMTRLTLTYGKF